MTSVSLLRVLADPAEPETKSRETENLIKNRHKI